MAKIRKAKGRKAKGKNKMQITTSIIGSTHNTIRFELYVDGQMAGELQMEKTAYANFIMLIGVSYGANRPYLTEAEKKERAARTRALLEGPDGSKDL